MALFVVASANANTPVPHAAFTTTNTSLAAGDGTGHCKNGNEAVNCNIYDGKQYVWLNGGPVAAALGDGDYFFAVLVPGGQGGNENPNDCTTNNLSDFNPCDTSTTGAGDAWTNRRFSVSNGAVSYGGTHTFDSNKIRLMPYDNTTNPGGVYILAICSLADASNVAGDEASNPPGVDPSDCKYDAFKVNGDNSIPPASDLTATKTADGSFDNTYKWTIAKAVDKTKVTLTSAGSATFNYTITVSHDSGTVGNVKVTGTISVTNPNVDSNNNVLPVDITGVTDKLSDNTDCTVTNGGAQTLTQAVTNFAYSCSLSAVPAGQLDNTATVTWDSQLLDNGAFLAAGSAPAKFEDIDFTGTDIDECVTVSDTYAGSLGTVCVGDPNPKTFTYSRTISFNPNAGTNCQSYDNTATFTTNDTGTTGSSSQTVQVCLSPLTIGYWQNHLARTGSAGCSGLPSGTGCSSNGPFTGTYLPKSLGNYSVDTILKAAQVFAANNCGNTGKGSTAQQNQNGIACLAAQLLAAKLNVANGAANCIVATINKSDDFLKGLVVDGVTGVVYTGPGGNYSGISTAQRNKALSLKDVLVNYNQGGGC